jgi:uncharacterized membrane protein
MTTRQTPRTTKSRWIRFGQRLLLIAIAFSLVVSCARLVWRAWTVESLLRSEETKLENLQLQKGELQDKIEVATSSFELERRAREELLLQASDEAIWRRE